MIDVDKIVVLNASDNDSNINAFHHILHLRTGGRK